jgi:5,10-methylenetetrahydromethanopterin reductase
VGVVNGDAPLRTGVWFQGGLKPRVAAHLASRAEAAGVDGVWVAEGPVARDAFITLSAIALVTKRVDLGTGVVNAFTRHPAQLAASFATLDELSEGRAVCGLGIGARDYLVPLGVDVSKPLGTARELVTLVRRLLARETVDHDGVKWRLDHVRLGLRPPREDIPIVLAATGPKMCRLAGEVADGIYLMYGCESYVTGAIGNARAGRTTDVPFTVASPILMAIDDDVAAARASLKIGIGLTLTEPYGEGMLESNGLDRAHAQRIRDCLATGGVRALPDVVEDGVVDALTIAGTRSQCLERLAQAVSWGITQPELLLDGGDPEPLLGVLAELGKAIA